MSQHREFLLQGEKLTADATGINPFKWKLQEVMEKERLTLEQLYNCDKTGLIRKSYLLITVLRRVHV